MGYISNECENFIAARKETIGQNAPKELSLSEMVEENTYTWTYNQGFLVIAYVIALCLYKWKKTQMYLMLITGMLQVLGFFFSYWWFYDLPYPWRIAYGLEGVFPFLRTWAHTLVALDFIILMICGGLAITAADPKGDTFLSQCMSCCCTGCMKCVCCDCLCHRRTERYA